MKLCPDVHMHFLAERLNKMLFCINKAFEKAPVLDAQKQTN